MTPERAAQADEASVAFQLAMTQIGAATIRESLTLWSAIPTTGAPTSVQSGWLRRVKDLILRRRKQARDLAYAHIRLTRALRTGFTIADPLKSSPPQVTLGELRREFASQIDSKAITSPALKSPSSGTRKPVSVDSGGPVNPSIEQSYDDDDDRILVEEIEALKAEEERLEREAEAEIEAALKALGTEGLKRRLRDIDTTAPAAEVDKSRAEAHKQAGLRQAEGAERIAMNGARGTSWAVHQKDKRVLGYIRVSQTGTPCGWCAMLISRGAVYKSKKTAEYPDGEKYHNKCHCIAVEVYSRKQYKESDAYSLNREYEKAWPEVTKGRGGKDAVSAWRKYIRLTDGKSGDEALAMWQEWRKHNEPPRWKARKASKKRPGGVKK